jgi:hypothetical protein
MSGKTKYKVGDEFYGTRRIVEYCGSHPKWRVSTWMWECLGCGTIHGPTTTATLTRKDRAGSLPSCCHPRNTFGPNSPRWTGYKELPHSYWSQVKRGAEQRGLEFDLSIRDMYELFIQQNARCALSDIELYLGYKDTNASLDRIDSQKGYTKDNIQWLHKDVNRIKSNFGEDRFLEICRAIARHNP